MAAKKSADLTVVENSTPPPAPVQQEGATILAMIDKIAALPDVPVEKIEQLWSLHERMEAARVKRAYLAALAEMQPKLPIIDRRGVIKTNEKDKQGNKTGVQVEQSKYALWEDIMEAVKPILAEHGFSLQHKIEQPDPARINVTAILGHREGHSESTSMSLPIDTSGSKNNVQGWGSSAQYAKRYTAVALLNVVSRDATDDDGAAGGGDATLTDEQIAIITRLLEVTMTEEPNFMAWVTARFKYPSKVSEIRGKDFEEVRDKLDAKRKQMGAGK